MPRGTPNDKPVVTIEIPQTRNGVLGRIDKLRNTFLMKAEALKIAADVIDEDDRQQAQKSAPRKFLQAINHRNGDGPVSQDERRETRLAALTKYFAEHPGGATTSEIREALQWNNSTLLKFIHQVARPTKKHPRGSRHPWTWLPKTVTSATMTNGSGKRRAPSSGRRTPNERKQEVTDYLRTHPGANTHDIAKGLGWRDNQVAKFASQVAKGVKPGPKQAFQWTLTARSAKKVTTKAASKKNGVVNAKTRPRADWEADVRAYLTDHPEAYTSEIAKALRRTPNSGFVKLVRSVARPARATTKTQAISWVLAEA